MSDAQSSYNDIRPLQVRFRLVHLFYLVALLAVSLGTFGAVGFWVGSAVGVFWALIFHVRALRVRFLEVVVILGAVACCLGLFLPIASPLGSPASRRLPPCMSHTRSIALALDAYDYQYGTLPPAYIADEAGQPMHSWRVLILPFLEEQVKYDQYRFDEPWNGPHNRQLLDPMPAAFACPSQPKSHFTNYLAVVGPNTAWPGSTGRHLSTFSDGTSETIVVVEAGEPQVLWMEPRDLTYDEALKSLSGENGNSRHDGHWLTTFFTERFAGRQIVALDGHCRFVEGNLPSRYWADGLVVNDGKGIVERTDGWPQPSARRRVGNYVRFAVWVLLTLWPLPYVVASIWNRHGKRTGASQLAGRAAIGR